MIRTVCHFTDSDAFGGAEQALLTLVRGLDRTRWRPILLHHAASGIAPLIEQARRLDVELRTVPPMPEGREGVRRVPQLVRLLRALRPDVFHAHLTWQVACKYGLVSAILARVSAVVATAQLFVELPPDRTGYVKQRLIAAGVDCYITCSREVARQFRQAYDIPTRKLHVVHNGVPVGDFDRRANLSLRAELAGDGTRPIVLATARLDEQKGLRYLIEAAALVQEAVFVLAGDGPERAPLERRARELGVGDRVVFLGHRDDIPALLACCDLLVLPSLFEGLGISLLEAMAAEKPVVASAIGGIDEAVVHGETGILVPRADPVALAGAIRTVLLDPVLAQKLAAAGKARVHQQFSAETMVRRVVAIYDRLLGVVA